MVLIRTFLIYKDQVVNTAVKKTDVQRLDEEVKGGTDPSPSLSVILFNLLFQVL